MMSATPAPQAVDVRVLSFTELFVNATYPLAIDSYQRPYVWGADKVDQLIKDLTEYVKRDSQTLGYYMGTVLCHERAANGDQSEHSGEAGKTFIIDGQQRLTSLCVLYHVINNSLPAKCELTYRNPESVRNIKQAQAQFEQSGLRDAAEWLFDRICFTVITVGEEDLAFTFFDTQNSRGVPLNATDLLKAYHLRAINGEKPDALRRTCAERWERLQKTKPILGHGSDFAPVLFHQFLWRARCWTGRNVHAAERDDEIIGEFRDRSITASSPETVPLYAARLNRFGSTLTLLPGDGHTVTPLPIRVSHRASDLPFAIRQPISQGVGFFLYADKYTSLVTELLDAKHPESEVRAFASFYREVMAPLSIYLRELFLLASVMYVDQFGYQQLLRFALWMEHVLGALRISKQYIFKQAPFNLLKDAPLNLLDVIASAYRPEDVIAHLMSIHWVNAEYDKEKIDADGKGVQGQHKRRVQNYYDRHTALKNKDAWITDAFITKKLT